MPALRRALTDVSAPVVAVLAADLPFLRGRHLRWLHAELTTGAAAGRAGAVLTDGMGRPQWLTGCWRTPELSAAAAGYAGDSLRGLLGPLDPALLHYDLPTGEPPPWLDCDTAADLHQARAWQQAGGPDPGEAGT